MSENPILAGVVGSPIAHSISPLIHGEWLRRAGINGRYDRIEVAPGYDNFARAMDELRVQGFAGVNVTLPHKENALRYADWSEKQTQIVGAANTLVFEQDQVRAYNTDLSGFTAALMESRFHPYRDWRAVILGAGGAARGVVAALQGLDVTRVQIANRTFEKAKSIADTFSVVQPIDWNEREEALKGKALLVNTTSLGMTDQPSLEIDLGGLPDDAVVADIVYSPLETPLLKTAKSRGLRTIDGLSMLMHQAVPGFQFWFGAIPVVDDDLRSLLIDALGRPA